MSQQTERAMKMGAHLSRRNFLITTAVAAAGTSLAASRTEPSASDHPFTGRLCFFSKHLPDMDPRRLAENVKNAGFNGIDLTVRKRGHVLPEKAVQDLPKAVAAIRAEGLEVPMITTELLSAADPTARPILSTAGRLGIPFLKPGYYRYEFVDVRKELEKAGNEFRGLVELAKESSIQVGYHNHAGYVGAPVWDMARIIDGLDPRWAGYYFDVRHSVVEGGDAGWKIAANLIAPRLKMIAVKDFYWEKTSRGWGQHNCPLGEGMVDWKQYFGVLARTGFRGPVSLHFEYDIPGTGATLEDNTLAAARRDLQFVKARLQEAYKM
ncbi:MAG TPA: sugar phosphate isomerase/epimerase family protein [Acidobacteriota bacterium]